VQLPVDRYMSHDVGSSDLEWQGSLRKILDCTGGDIYGERGAQAYNGGLGAEPPAGSMGRAPSQGSGAKPPEADSILAFER